MEHAISIRAHFERFPATVKGAFVLRGARAVTRTRCKIQAARVAELASRTARPLEIDPVTLDVAPHLDLFVPFEFPLTELGPGWYGLECDVDDRRRARGRASRGPVRRAVAPRHDAARQCGGRTRRSRQGPGRCGSRRSSAAATRSG